VFSYCSPPNTGNSQACRDVQQQEELCEQAGGRGGGGKCKARSMTPQPTHSMLLSLPSLTPRCNSAGLTVAGTQLPCFTGSSTKGTEFYLLY